MSNKEFLKAFNKTFAKNGSDAARRASDPQAYKGEVIEFPSLSLGDASHYWGLPLGKITQFHGPEGCGKTFFAMLMVKQAQDKYPGSSVVWFDAEYSFNEAWAKNLGIDIERLVIVSENNAATIFTMLCGRTNDQGKKIDLGILDHIAQKSLDCKLVVLDSIANLIYPIEENRGFEEQEMAAGARFLMKGMKRTTPMLADTGTAFLCINQAREKIGERIPTLTYPGGRPYRHTLSLAVLFKASGAKDGQIQSDDERKLGHKILATVEKTRGGPDKWKSEFWLDFAKGVVNRGAEAAMLGSAYGLISRPNAVSWIYEDLNIKGKDAFAAALEARPDLIDKLVTKIREIKQSGNGRAAVLSEDDSGPVSDFAVDDAEVSQ